MRKVDLIIIHCSASPDSRDIGAKEIDLWHKERGFLKIGYHYVIRRSGKLEKGREEEEIGAHCQGLNKNSIGICLVGEKNFSTEQFSTLKTLTRLLKEKYPNVEILGHRDTPSGIKQGKMCPGFNVKQVI